MKCSKIVLHIKDPKDVLLVSDALLKSGYTVSNPRKKVGSKYELYVVAYLPSAEQEED
ncbi:MAG: hypothetical protein PHI98_01225 [Eubacteriales bacterium]|nr:hypothetical protein [Eubacteriales bacterium]